MYQYSFDFYRKIVLHILPPYSLRIIKRRQKGTEQSLGSSNSVFSPIKDKAQKGGESEVSLNPKYLVLVVFFNGDISQIYR